MAKLTGQKAREGNGWVRKTGVPQVARGAVAVLDASEVALRELIA